MDGWIEYIYTVHIYIVCVYIVCVCLCIYIYIHTHAHIAYTLFEQVYLAGKNLRYSERGSYPRYVTTEKGLSRSCKWITFRGREWPTGSSSLEVPSLSILYPCLFPHMVPKALGFDTVLTALT